MHLFEQKNEICYCVPNGASACAPCRERRAAKNAEKPAIIGVDWGKESSLEACRRAMLGRLSEGRFFRDMYYGYFPNE